jgi:hypothetical protein
LAPLERLVTHLFRRSKAMRKTLLVLLGIFLGFGFTLLVCGHPAPLPRAEAQTAGTPASGSQAIMATGGSAPNLNDLCWVMRRERDTDPEGQAYDRYTLSLYRAMGNGRFFDLVDTREVTYDNKPVQLKIAGHNDELNPLKIKKKAEEEENKREEESRNRTRRSSR